jgi:DNA-directed RNA polymerase specialized sigma24 family protein
MSHQSLALNPSRCACGASAGAHAPIAESDERRLVAGMIAGAERAWREYDQRYARGVQRCITSVTSRFSAVVGADDVREIYATFCIRLLEGDKHKLRTFDPTRGYSLKSWFGMLAVQTTYEYLRKRKRETGRDRRGGEGVMGSAAPDPYEQTWERQRSELAGSFARRVLRARSRVLPPLFRPGLRARADRTAHGDQRQDRLHEEAQAGVPAGRARGRAAARRLTGLARSVENSRT